MKHIIKNKGYSELYSHTKYETSLLKTLYGVSITPKQAKTIANSICQAADSWLDNKHEVTSLDIRVFTKEQLAKYSPEAAILYKKYGNIW